MLNLDPVSIDEAVTFFDSDCEMNGFYYVCGGAVKKVLCESSCSFCTDVLTTSNPHGLLFRSNAMLTLIKSYVKNPLQFNLSDTTSHLCHPTSIVLNFLKHVEIAFRSSIAQAIYA